LRPTSLDTVIGQTATVALLKQSVTTSRQRNTPLGHILLEGPTGTGKTSIAEAVANELEGNFVSQVATYLSNPYELSDLIVSSSTPLVFFIDEIHSLKKPCQEALFRAMEDWQVAYKSKWSRTPTMVKVEPFTLIGASTEVGKLAAPFIGRFKYYLTLDEYTEREVIEIIQLGIGDITIAEDALSALVSASRLNPRRAVHLLSHCQDLPTQHITKEDVKGVLESLGISPNGMTKQDRKLLSCLVENFGGGPVGLQSLSLASMIDKDTIRNSIEPFLARLGLLEFTPKGRKIPDSALMSNGA